VVISGFDWDDANVSHIVRHQFTPEEVEEVFAGDYKVRRIRSYTLLWVKPSTVDWDLSCSAVCQAA